MSFSNAIRKRAATVAFLCAGFTSPVFAQAISGLSACLDSEISNSELTDRLTSNGWKSCEDASSTLQTVIFLGNVDAESPETWQKTHDWAASLASGATSSGVQYCQRKTRVIVGSNVAGHGTCLVVSDELLLDELQTQLGRQSARTYGTRRFFRALDGDFDVMASEWPIQEIPKELRSPGNWSFAATIVRKKSP